MGLRCYLAMTAAEFRAATAFPPHLGWMACHFSCYGLGLTNIPTTLPPGAMLIINDRTPVNKHDPEIILSQLQELIARYAPDCILLDFQRPDQAQTALIAQAIVETLPCRVGVSECYAKELDCPVFLPPPPLHKPLKDHLQPWLDREIWLEAALTAETITVTETGSQIENAEFVNLSEPYFTDETLHCNYQIKCNNDSVIFTLQRSKSQLSALLEEAECHGITQTVGLFQQLGHETPP